jgi:hypothetical protein
VSDVKREVDDANAARAALRDSVQQTTPPGLPSRTAMMFGALYFQGVAGEPARPGRWVEIANKMLGDVDDPHIGFQLQQCGFLDALLIAFESEPRTNPGTDPGALYIAGQSFEFSIGDSWLLFVYEVLRTFRWSKRFAALPDNSQEAFKKLFRLVALARIPIAKHEAHGTRWKSKKGEADTFVFNAPIHIFHDGLGTAGWRVFDKVTGKVVDILRKPLADALLLWAEGDLSDKALAAITTPGSRELIRIVKT